MLLGECLLCLLVQVYCDYIYLQSKSIVTASNCTLCVCIVLLQALLFLFPTMGNKKIPCACDPACKGGVKKDSNTLPVSVDYNDNLANM